MDLLIERIILLFLLAIIIPPLSVYVLFLRPPTEPKGIPAIPFWITLIALWKDVDQEVIFKRYIREPLLKYGAVKIFFASQWNILVERPSMLAQIFKEEDDFQKSGNHIKIPGSVLASYLGENIISSHGGTWRTFRAVMQPGLQEKWTIDGIVTNSELLSQKIAESITPASAAASQSEPVAVRGLLQRYTTANIAHVIMGVDLESMQRDDAPINQLQTAIKQQIFKPIFMNFPFLDSLGLPSRERARLTAKRLTDYLVSKVTEVCQAMSNVRTQTNLQQESSTKLAKSELSTNLLNAWERGQISTQQLRHNLTIVFVAGQENPELAAASVLYLLAKNPQYQKVLYHECVLFGKEDCNSEELSSMPQMTAIVLESLRLLPPIGQLINRRASKDLLLGREGLHIPQGMYLGYNSYATNRDPVVWGPDADEFRPERWGSSTEAIQMEYRRRKARAEFISFHGGRRACLGERFAILQLKVMLFVLIRRFHWRLDPTWPDRMTPAGPLSPRGVRLVFEMRNWPAASI